MFVPKTSDTTAHPFIQPPKENKEIATLYDTISHDFAGKYAIAHGQLTFVFQSLRISTHTKPGIQDLICECFRGVSRFAPDLGPEAQKRTHGTFRYKHWSEENPKIGLKSKIGKSFRNALSTAGNSMTISERSSQGGENSGSALDASNAFNYRGVGNPSRTLDGNSRKRPGEP